jgi:hypothetical protein
MAYVNVEQLPEGLEGVRRDWNPIATKYWAGSRETSLPPVQEVCRNWAKSDRAIALTGGIVLAKS